MVGIRPRLNKLVGLSLILVGLSTNIRGWVYLAFYGPGVYLASTRSRVPNNLFGSDNNGWNPPPIEQGRWGRPTQIITPN